MRGDAESLEGQLVVSWRRNCDYNGFRKSSIKISVEGTQDTGHWTLEVGLGGAPQTAVNGTGDPTDWDIISELKLV
ncbi:hypothetical protein WAI453_013414 [Rhynchosporium graminicola]